MEPFRHLLVGRVLAWLSLWSFLAPAAFAFSPGNNTVRYIYKADGDLDCFFDREHVPGTNPPTQRFEYTAGTRYLTGILDGQRVPAARNVYDPVSGRLTETTDATGKRTVFTHNVSGRVETITDRAGKVTRHFYDERGNVTRTEQPDGTVVTMAYHVWSEGRKSDLKVSESISGLFSDGSGALFPKTLTTFYSYEDEDPATKPANDGLLRKLTDPLGHVTRFSYEERGNVLSVTDPLGRATVNTYVIRNFKSGPQTTNLLETSTDAAGNVTGFTYDAGGRMDKETRTVTMEGAVQTLVTDYDYDANGFLVKLTDAAGHVTTYENDVHGNRRFERTTRTVPGGGVVNVVTEHDYNAEDRLVKTWDAEHPRASHPQPASETVYEDHGKPAVTYDALRRTTQHTYKTRAACSSGPTLPTALSRRSNTTRKAGASSRRTDAGRRRAPSMMRSAG